jgi:hypothetical protein
MFKHLLGRRHLLSIKHEGIELQGYSAIIASVLILLYKGRAPSKRTLRISCFYMSGWASLAELEQYIGKLKPTDS